MKDNIVQELLLRTLFGQKPDATSATKAAQYQNTQAGPLEKREILLSLLKSLYLDNAQKKQGSNVNNVNNSNGTKILNNPQTGALNTNRTQQIPQIFKEFIKENPDFFNQREVLFEYLNSANANLDLDELNKIAQITKTIEEEAIKRFCAKNPKYAQFLTNENSKLTNKLEKDVLDSLDGDLKNQQFYSAQDINKMSTDEFLKHKDEIDAQILNLIKNS